MHRQNVFADIRKRGNPYESITSRVNLMRRHRHAFPLKRAFRYAVISVALISFFFGSVYAPISGSYSLAASNTDTQRAQLQAQLQQIEAEISQNEDTVALYEKQGSSLSGEIKILNAKIASLNLQIKAIVLNLDQLSGDISTTKTKITSTQGDIDSYKGSLSALLENLYETEQQNTIEILMKNPHLSDFFLNINSLLASQDSLRATLQKIVDLKNQLMNQKEALASQYNDTQQLQQYQLAQQQQIQQTEAQKNTLLKITKGQEAKYQQIVNQKKQTAAQIRAQIYQLIGGGQLSFGDAYNLAKAASDATGVRAALILAVLDRESALGRNVGQCKYDVNPYYPDQASNKTTMHPTRDIPIFLQITKSLGIDPESVNVSCPIPRDGAYGGGMGPAQFIPSTWIQYSDQIGQLTGHNPPSPWNNMDAFMATALYLKNAGAGSTSYSERVAAAKYYAGGNWSRFINSYGAAVVSKAQEFQSDIDVLNGQAG